MDNRELIGQQDYEVLDGVIHSISVRSDFSNHTKYSVGQELEKVGLKISSIHVMREFLNKFGKVHAVVNVVDGDSERTYLEIVDGVVLIHDLRVLMEKNRNERSRHGERGGSKTIATKE